MPHLDILSSHEHNIANIKKVDPVHLAHSSITLNLGWFGHPESISLRRFILVGISLHSFNLFDWTEAHLERLDHLRVDTHWVGVAGSLVHWVLEGLAVHWWKDRRLDWEAVPVRDQRLVLEDDVCELLLLVFELEKKLLDVRLVRFQWLEFVTNIVGSFGVLVLLWDVQRVDRGKVVYLKLWLWPIFLLRGLVRKSIALLAAHVAKDCFWINELRILEVLFDSVLKLGKTCLLVNLALFTWHHRIILTVYFFNVVFALVDTWHSKSVHSF